jgi:alpha-galactosidase
MRDALNKTGRPIFYSICDWGVDNPWEWGNATGNSWRTTYDISDNYGSFTSILDLQTGLEKFAGPGSWNDPDMLEVGNGGMTTAEYQAHFSLWALLKAPLILGCDLDKVTPATMAIIGNEEVIALSQDPLGKQGRLVRNGQGSGGIVQLYAMTLSDGSKGVVIFNRGSRPANFELNVVADLSLPGSKGVRVRDLVKHADIGLYHQDTIIFTGIESHGCLTLKFTSVDNEASI